MTKPKITIHNTQTNEVIDREMTNAEFAQYETEQAKNVLAKQEAQLNATAKAALLTKLGITAEEAALLLS